MRITGRQLRRIIQEEVARMMNEEEGQVPGTGTATGATVTAGNGAIESFLKEKSDIAGVAFYRTHVGASAPYVSYLQTPVDGTLIWNARQDGSAVMAYMVKLNSPITDRSTNNSIGAFNIQSSYGTASGIDLPKGWLAHDTDRTRTGVKPPSGVTPGQRFKIPVKVKFGIDYSEELREFVIAYDIKPA